MSRSRLVFPLSVAVLLALVVLLREFTMAVPTPPDRSAVLTLVLDADVRYDPDVTGQDRAVALARVCALRVDAEIPPGFVHDLPGARVLVAVTPAVQGTDRDELRGCIEDLALRRMLVDVEEMRAVPLPVAAAVLQGAARAG